MLGILSFVNKTFFFFKEKLQLQFPNMMAI